VLYLYVYKEKRKDAKSQSEHNFICVQNQLHVSAIYIVVIKLNMEP